jgi:hypothetical protein
VAWISLRAGASCLNLTYRVRVSGGEWQDVEETVRIVCIPCRFGGARPYFICPGVVNGITCGRRVAKLANEYRAFVSALVAEHLPQGPTEEHLVEEPAGTSLFALPFSTPSRSAEISLLVVSHLCFGRKRVPTTPISFVKLRKQFESFSCGAKGPVIFIRGERELLEPDSVISEYFPRIF